MLQKRDLVDGMCVIYESNSGKTYDVTICGMKGDL